MFFQEIMKAITDFSFYEQAKDFYTSKSIKYIFLFLLMVTVILAPKFIYVVNKNLTLAVKWSGEKLPTIHINDGIVSVDAPQPYTIEVENSVIIIDTTEKITSLDKYKTGMLLTKDKLIIKYIKRSVERTDIYNLSNFKILKSLTIDKPFLKKVKKILLLILIPLMLVAMYIRFCIARFMQILFFSLISLVISSASAAKLSYKQIFNIGVYAITPSMILGLLSAIFFRHIPFFIPILYCGTYVIYLIIAINASKKTIT